MGIVNCANEQYGTFDDDPAILRHLDRHEPTGIFQRSHEVYERARASGRTPAAEAELLAEELSEEPHPIWGDRGRQIIAALVREGYLPATLRDARSKAQRLEPIWRDEGARSRRAASAADPRPRHTSVDPWQRSHQWRRAPVMPTYGPY